MELISVNIGRREELVRPNKTETTGIFKRPVSGPVRVTRQGLPDDFIGDHKHHGGPDQAVYVYGTGDYDWWAAELGQPMEAGMFGENLTIRGLYSVEFNIGDRLHIGPVILEVTAPRIPCGTLAGRMRLPDFVKRFRAAGRPGLYCRVIEEGSVQPGDTVRLERHQGKTISIPRAMQDHYEPELTEEAIRQFLDAPVAIRLRAEKEEQLARLQSR